MSEKFNQQEYINKFVREKYDSISVRVPKGYNSKFKKLAEKHGLSMAAYIVKLVDADDAES